MAAYDTKDDPRDFKGPAPMSNRLAQSSSAAAAAAASSASTAASSASTAATSIRPWRESVSINKRRLSATGSAAASETVSDETIQRSQKKIKTESAAAYALGITGIRQTIIRQALLERGGECVLVTGDGQRCDRATQYIRDQGIEGKERSIDCLPYCRNRCKEWSRGVLANPPTAVIAFVDGKPIGRFPISQIAIQFGRERMNLTTTGWKLMSLPTYAIAEAIDKFCELFSTVPSIVPLVAIEFKSFVAFRRQYIGGLPSTPTAAEWKQISETGRLTFKFEGTMHPLDGVWIGPWKRWTTIVAVKAGGIALSTTFPLHAEMDANLRSLKSNQ